MSWWKKISAKIKKVERRKVSRKRYWYIFAVTFPIIVLSLQFEKITEGKEQSLLVEGGVFLVFFPALIFFGITTIQRCNDIGMNRTGLTLTWLMLILLPYMEIVIPLILGVLEKDSLADFFDQTESEKHHQKKSTILKYVSFYGKAPRLEYWCLTVASVTLPLVLIGAFWLAFFVFFSRNSLNASIIILFLILAALVYSFAAIRRCRDAAISPLYTLLILIPYTGWITAIAIGCVKTNEGKKPDLPSDSRKEDRARSPSEIWKNLSKKLTIKQRKTLLYQGRIMLLCHARVIFVIASIVFWLWTTSIAIQFFRTLFLVAFYGIRHIK